jgi:KDO2-lipid IV(A) lauroyltransferase
MAPNLKDRLANFLAYLWYRLDRRHREITLHNLEFAYGPELSPEEREHLARLVFRHFVLFGWEILELLLAPLSMIRKKVIVLGAELVDEVLAQGRGMIAVAAHAGNWEYSVFGYGLQYRPVAVVGRELEHPVGRALARYLRQRGGNFMLDKQRGLKGILAHLKQNRPVGIVIDQNTTTEGGLLVDFFGRKARTTPVAAILARHRDIPVLPVFSRRLPGGCHLLAIFPPIPMEKTRDADADILRHLQLQSRAVEAWVRACPEQWLWLHRRWKNQYPEIYESRDQGPGARGQGPEKTVPSSWFQAKNYEGRSSLARL